jgi:hypothetical protein
MRRVLGSALALCAVLTLVPARAAAQIGAPVVGLEAQVSSNNIVLTWTGTDEDEGHFAEASMLGGFTVLGALSPGGPVIASAQIPWVPPGPEGSFLPIAITGAPDGVFWIVVVKGLTSATSAQASAWVQVVVSVNNCGSAPLAPTSLQNLPTPGKPVALSWTPASTGCPPTQFVVAAGSGPGLSDLAVVEISGAVTILHGTAPAGTYHVRVHARNSVGISGPSNEVQVTVAEGCVGPGPPINLAATVVSGNRLQLSWSPPASGDLSHLTGYRLIGRIVGNPLFGGTVDVGPITSLLTGPIASNSYEIQVQAISVCPGSAPQLSAPSLPVTVVVP